MRDFASLPDILSVEEVKTYFEEIFSSAQAAPREQVIAALFEVMQRQLSTYSPLEPSLRGPIEQLVCQHWDTSRAGLYLNQLLSLVINLELGGCIPLLEKALQGNELSEDVRTELSQALEEFREMASV